MPIRQAVTLELLPSDLEDNTKLHLPKVTLDSSSKEVNNSQEASLTTISISSTKVLQEDMVCNTSAVVQDLP